MMTTSGWLSPGPAGSVRIVKGTPTTMHTQPREIESSSRPSKFIAEALIGRHGPRQIASSADAIGLPAQLTKVIVVACTATAVDAAFPRHRSYAAAN